MHGTKNYANTCNIMLEELFIAMFDRQPDDEMVNQELFQRTKEERGLRIVEARHSDQQFIDPLILTNNLMRLVMNNATTNFEL